MQKRTSQTNGLSGRAQATDAITTEPMTSTPPIVGVPCLPPCNSARCRTSAAVRIGCPILSEISFRMTKLPKRSEIAKAVIAARTARKVT